MHRPLYISVEIAKREMFSRLLVALEAKRCGIEVIFGQKWAIEQNLATLPKGVVLYKTIDEPQCDNAYEARKYGHLSIGTNEEGLMPYDGGYSLNQIGTRVTDSFNIILCHSIPQLKTIASHHNPAPKMILTGNPRVDLLRDKFRPFITGRAEVQKSKYGDFILFNSNQATNWKFGNADKFRQHLVNNKMIDTATRDSSYFDDLQRYDLIRQGLTNQFFDCLFAREPNARVLIRPHPGENTDSWNSFIRHYKNCVLVEDDIAAVLIAAAKVTVVTGCTTGIEGRMMNRPVINLDIEEDPGYHNVNICYRFLDNYISIDNAVCDTLRYLYDELPEYSDPGLSERRRMDLEKHLEASEEFAFRRIVNSLIEHIPELKSQSSLTAVEHKHFPIMPALVKGQWEKVSILNRTEIQQAVDVLAPIMEIKAEIKVVEVANKIFSLNLN